MKNGYEAENRKIYASQIRNIRQLVYIHKRIALSFKGQQPQEVYKSVCALGHLLQPPLMLMVKGARHSNPRRASHIRECLTTTSIKYMYVSALTG